MAQLFATGIYTTIWTLPLSMALGSSQDDMGRSADPSPFMARKHLDIVAGLLKERQERTMKEREAAAEKEEETRAAS